MRAGVARQQPHCMPVRSHMADVQTCNRTQASMCITKRAVASVVGGDEVTVIMQTCTSRSKIWMECVVSQ